MPEREKRETPHKKKSRLLKRLAKLGFGLTMLLPGASAIGQETPPSAEAANAALEFRELAAQLEALTQGHEIGLKVGLFDQNGQLVEQYANREDEVFPIASSFKAFVVFYYYYFSPAQQWQTGPHTDIYNVAVYSHNRTTGTILHEVGELRRAQDPSLANQNDLQLFNSFLRDTVGLEHGLAGWGFDSAAAGQTDPLVQPQPVTHRGRTDYVGNVTTAADLFRGYELLLSAPQRPQWQSDQRFRQAIQATWHQLSLVDADPKYHSGVDRAFPDQPHIGKDGILIEEDLPNLGPIYTEGSILPLGNSYLVLTYLAEGESGSYINDLLSQIRRFTDGHFDQAAASYQLQPDGETQALLDASNFYEFTGVAEIDRVGAVEVNYRPFVEDQSYQAVVTTNLFDGTFTVWIRDSQGNFQADYTTWALVGERLPPSSGVAEDFNNSSNGESGSRFDGQRGVEMMRYRPDGPEIPRSTFTLPGLFEFHGFTATNGFGGLPVTTRHAAMWMITESGHAGLHSQYTFHEIPPFPSAHYDGRRRTLQSAVELQRQGADAHYRRTWSHGCVNLLPSEYTEVVNRLQAITSAGGRVGVVFSYPGLDQSILVAPTGFETEQDPFYAENVGNWTDQFIFGSF